MARKPPGSETSEIKAVWPQQRVVAIGVAKVIFRAHLGDCRGGSAAGDAAPRPEDLMFITPAFAQGGLSAMFGGDSGPMSSFLVPMALMLVIFYFLMFRPQQKRQKQHQEMIKNVRKGDTVITNGGLVGKVTKVIDDEKVEVELASDVRVVQLRSMLTDVRAKGEPVKEAASS
jgi:preprotein translocase subunit YajC